MIATSLPAIAASLNEDPIALKLAITSYLVSLAIFIPVSGWMADRYGARTVFRAALAVFMAGSIACAAAGSLGGFVAARFLQGMGGAMMVPVGRLVLLRSIPKSEMVSALAYLTVPAMVGPVVGPPLGGFITTYLDWRWIFFINIPIGLLGIVLSTLYFENIREPDRPPLDLAGFALSGFGLAALMLGLATGGRHLLPMEVSLGCVVAGTIAVIAYVRHARRIAHPLVRLDLLRIPTFRASVLGGSFFRIGVGAIPFLLPLMLQLGFGLNPFQSGLLTFVSAAGALFMKTLAARILRTFGFRAVLTVNAFIAAAFIGANGLFTPATPYCRDRRGAPRRRLLPLASVHGAQCHRLCRRVEPRDEPRHGPDERRPAAFAQPGGRARGGGAGDREPGPGRTELRSGDFWPAFLLVALIAASPASFLARLDPSAGAELSGHAIVRAKPAATLRREGADPPRGGASVARNPPEMTAMDQRIIDLYDTITHGGMTRRAFLDRLAALAGGAAAATALLPLLQNNYALAQIVPEADPRIVDADDHDRRAPKGLTGYLVKPKARRARPAVIVIHENRGLNPHIKDVARRVAIEGFLALAPGLSEPDRRHARGRGQGPRHDRPAEAAGRARHLPRRPLRRPEAPARRNGKVGAVGFCWGGGQVNALAVADPTSTPASPITAASRRPTRSPSIKAPLLLHYAGNDERINAGIAGLRGGAEGRPARPTSSTCIRARNHAFNNDTNAARYNKEAADLAWGRTIAFFRKHLGDGAQRSSPSAPHANPLPQAGRGVTPEPGRQHVELGRVGPARRRLDVAHAREIALQVGEERALGAALQHLGDEGAARREHRAGEIGRGLGEADDAQMVGLPVAGGVGGHVGHDDVGRAAERSTSRSGASSSRKSSCDELGARHRLDRQQVDADDPAPALRAADPLRPRPATSRRAPRRDRRPAAPASGNGTSRRSRGA